MANFDIQGESHSLSEKQIKFICEVLEKHDFSKSKVIVGTLSKAGDNYSSNMKTITAQLEDGKILKMVAKVAPTSEFLRETVNVDAVFGNEFLMYDKILPKFRQLEIEGGIPEEDMLKFPICYGILHETLHEIILLEDLRESGYIMKDRLKSLTNEEVRIMLISFAKLHSLSFVLKENNPAMYKEFTSKLSDFYTSPQLEANVNNGFSLVEEYVSSLFDTNKYKDRIKGSVRNVINEAHELKQCDAVSNNGVIIHGDSWTNNILLKLNNINGDPEDCMLIDYQLSTEKCPISDFLYLIFSCTDYDTRSKHYDDWVEVYHKHLAKYLSYYDIKAEYVYSKEKMLVDLKRYSKFFLGWSIMVSNVLCMDTEEATRFKNTLGSTDNVEEIMESIKTDSADSKTQNLLKTRVQGIIDSYYELGYFS